MNDYQPLLPIDIGHPITPEHALALELVRLRARKQHELAELIERAHADWMRTR